MKKLKVGDKFIVKRDVWELKKGEVITIYDIKNNRYDKTIRKHLGGTWFYCINDKDEIIFAKGSGVWDAMYHEKDEIREHRLSKILNKDV